jgi:hypothetical protein
LSNLIVKAIISQKFLRENVPLKKNVTERRFYRWGGGRKEEEKDYKRRDEEGAEKELT